MFQSLLPLPLSFTTTRSCFQQTQPTATHIHIYTHPSTPLNQEGPHNMLQIKGAPVSHQEARSYKSHFIRLHLLAKLLRTLLREGRAPEQLPHISPVSQWGTKPSFILFALPAHTLRQNPKQGAQTGQTGCSAEPGTHTGGMASPCSTLPYGGGTQPCAAGWAGGRGEHSPRQHSSRCGAPLLHSLQNNPPSSPLTSWPSRALFRRIKS